jgi:glycosyltransferase involved in cell wall biosynthesis
MRLVPPAGGDGTRNKLDILWKAPTYLRAIADELRHADVVHVRCPANISLLATALLSVTAHPAKRWVKYAGNWRPAERDAWSYRLQRWWLTRGFQRGVVTVNGHWPGQPAHVHSFLNPCLTDEELEDAGGLVEHKRLCSPIRLLYVGRLEAEKGVAQAIEVLARLRDRAVPATLDLVGDGPERQEFEALGARLRLDAEVCFHGWLARTALTPLYARAHIFVFPTSSEGWPKVLSEGMAYGVVPLSTRVSSIPQYLEEFGTGRAFAPGDVESFASAIAWYWAHPDAWAEEAANGRRAAARFSYGNYLRSVSALLDLPARSIAAEPASLGAIR